MDQTPPEKMTAEQTIESLRQTESGLAYLAKVMWSEGESTESVAMEQHVRNVQSALLHLEEAQADKARLDWLEEHEWQMSKDAPSGILGCVHMPVTEYSSMHFTSVRGILDRAIAHDWEFEATKIRVSATAAQTSGEIR